MTKNKAKRLRSQYLKTYSTIAQSIRLMKNDDVSLDPKTYSSGNSFFKTYVKYFKGAHLCTPIACYKRDDTIYKTLDGKYIPPYHRFDDGQFLLMDNTLIMLENPYGSSDAPLWIHADINGKNKPNKWGVDRFVFVFTEDNAVIPYTGKDAHNLSKNLTSDTEIAKYCSSTATTIAHTCAYFALKNKRPEGKGDYWHDFLRGK